MGTTNNLTNGIDKGTLRDSLITGQTSGGVELHATLLRLTRFLAVFEIYNPGLVLRTSEVLSDFRIVVNDRPIYAGRAVVSNLVNAGAVLVCEATLEDFWLEPDFYANGDAGNQPRFSEFFQQWQRIYKVRPEFKVVVADMQSFLMDLRLWLEQMELGIRSAPTGDRVSLERELAAEIGQSTTPALTNLFEKFESTLDGIDPEFHSVHRIFGRRQLHPLLLCSPFLYRTFSKPLGYAGDYEMINMIMRDPFEGGSLYAKIINLWFLQQAPAEAHRNRIDYLLQHITQTVARAASAGRVARILTLGCGAAHETQRFLRESHLANHARFALLDFNLETLTHAQAVIEQVKRQHQCTTQLSFLKKSVHQILKDSGKSVESTEQYDLVYCAGLFDYLTDPVCRRLTNILYDWTAPGGTLITTNVDSSNPRRVTMDYLMEWHLMYRSGAELSALKPERAAADSCEVRADVTGVNIYSEARKPGRG